MFQTKVVEAIKIHISVQHIPPPQKKKYCGYEIIWRNIVDWSRPQMTVWRMRNSSWIPETTSTHSEYVVLIAFPLQQRLRECASMLRYTYISCLVLHLVLLFFVVVVGGVFHCISLPCTVNFGVAGSHYLVCSFQCSRTCASVSCDWWKWHFTYYLCRKSSLHRFSLWQVTLQIEHTPERHC
jgi:hypothetical protein